MDSIDTNNPPSLLTPKQIRQILGLRGSSNHTLRNWERAGILFPIRINSRTLRYRRCDLEGLVTAARKRESK